MKEVFFSATQKALDNITAMYDSVWPTTVGMWNLRRMVNDVKQEHPDITEPQLVSRFSYGSGIHSVNYKRAFQENIWEEQQTDFAWIILNSTFPIYEGWLDELKGSLFPNLKVKKLQYPNDVRNEVSRVVANRSVVMHDCFYSVYLGKKNRCYSNIESLLYCYRVFKEARNCYMHHGSIADQELIDVYNSYLPYATKGALNVKEVPVFSQPTLNAPIQLSLRGVVGLSDILIKIIVSLDTELLCAVEAEQEFIERYKAKHKTKRCLKTDCNEARSQVQRYVHQCGFVLPNNPDTMISFLLAKRLVSR